MPISVKAFGCGVIQFWASEVSLRISVMQAEASRSEGSGCTLCLAFLWGQSGEAQASVLGWGDPQARKLIYDYWRRITQSQRRVKRGGHAMGFWGCQTEARPGGRKM